jgi:hypothetical protein
LNNLHIWVFVKWELKELKLGVKESQVLDIWKKKSESKNRFRLWLFQKTLQNCWVSRKPIKEEPCKFLGGCFTLTKQLNSHIDRPAASPASPSPTPQNPLHKLTDWLSELIY